MKRLLYLLGFLGVTLVSCQEELEIIDERYGKLVVNITDAPFPLDIIEDVEFTIVRSEIFTDYEDSLNRRTLFNDTVVIHPLKLQNGLTEKIAEMELPSGYYSSIKLYVGGAVLETKDHGTFEMKVPSGAQSGLKIKVNPPVYVQGGLTAELLLDFDISRSFVMQGNIDTPAGIKGVSFKPVIRASNNTTSGRIQGFVKDTAENIIKIASIWLERDTIVSSTNSDTTGFYAMIGIPAGDYVLRAAREGFDTTSVKVSIIRGNVTSEDLQLLPMETDTEVDTSE